jgi:hypothetical protein
MLTVTKWVDVVTNRVDVPARVLMSLLFLASGVGKISAVAATQGYMKAFGVPGVLLWPAAAWEITAGVFFADRSGNSPAGAAAGRLVPVDGGHLPRRVGRPNSAANVPQEHDDGGGLPDARKDRILGHERRCHACIAKTGLLMEPIAPVGRSLLTV